MTISNCEVLDMNTNPVDTQLAAQEAELQDALERRILEMESESYEFPKRFSGKDYILVLAVAIVCFAALLWGAGL
jgi:hypothetical protein